jgi:hypothetical protein
VIFESRDLIWGQQLALMRLVPLLRPVGPPGALLLLPVATLLGRVLGRRLTRVRRVLTELDLQSGDLRLELRNDALAASSNPLSAHRESRRFVLKSA